jgi:hypothetical protein
MVARFVAELERPISRVRLEAHRPASGDDFAMLIEYFYNIGLSEAPYPVLQAFEVSLRNSINATLTTHFQTPYWFDLF